MVASYRLHDQIEQNLDKIDTQQVDIATLKLQRHFNDLKFKLAQRASLYSSTHKSIEQQLLRGKTLDLGSIKAQYDRSLEFAIDVFIVSPEWVITSSTYPPDEGLDFKAPFFTDAQAALAHAKGASHVVIGQPTLEIISLRHKLYTVSHLSDGRYLEVGFIDPQISEIFSQAQETIMAEQGLLSVEFYTEHNRLRLSPLTQLTTFEPTVSKYKDKTAYLSLVDEYLAQQHEHFKALNTGEFTAVPRPNKANESFFYVVLDSAQLTPDYALRTIAKLHVTHKIRTWWEQYLYLVPAAAAAVMGITLLLFLWHYPRYKQTQEDIPRH